MSGPELLAPFRRRASTAFAAVLVAAGCGLTLVEVDQDSVYTYVEVEGHSIDEMAGLHVQWNDFDQAVTWGGGAGEEIGLRDIPLPVNNRKPPCLEVAVRVVDVNSGAFIATVAAGTCLTARGPTGQATYTLLLPADG